jgi:hypothetical protein
LVANDQVIQHVDIEQLAGLGDLPRDGHVLGIYMENRFDVIVRKT